MSLPCILATQPPVSWLKQTRHTLSYRQVRTAIFPFAFAHRTNTYLIAFTNSSSYWSDEVKLSIPSSAQNSLSPKYLITGTRSHLTSSTGYVSAFALDPITGNITAQLFLLSTTGSGGSANAVSPATFNEDYFAITDSGDNFIEVWKIEESSGNETSSATASVVAHFDLDNGPANVVWYS